MSNVLLFITKYVDYIELACSGDTSQMQADQRLLYLNLPPEDDKPLIEGRRD